MAASMALAASPSDVGVDVSVTTCGVPVLMRTLRSNVAGRAAGKGRSVPETRATAGKIGRDPGIATLTAVSVLATTYLGLSTTASPTISCPGAGPSINRVPVTVNVRPVTARPLIAGTITIGSPAELIAAC